MKYMLMLAAVAAIGLIGAEAPAQGTKTCSTSCDAKYEQCFKDAVEFGHSGSEARTGCGEKRKACKERCK